MVKICIAFTLFLFSISISLAQGSYTSNNSEIERIIDKFEVLYSTDSSLYYTGFKPYSRKLAGEFMSKLNMLDSNRASVQDLEYAQKELSFWMQPSSEKFKRTPIFNYFYPNQASFLEVNAKDFWLKINPMLELKYGKEKDNSNSIYQNTRGLEITGNVAKNFNFYVNFTENQSRYYDYINQYASGFNHQNSYNFNPNFGYWKEFGTNGFDYNNSIGYIDVSIPKYFNLALGHDRQFIGYGLRSLFLGDGSAPHFFLKSTLNIWKLNYQVLFTQFTGQYIRGGDRLLPKKFGAFHLLKFKPSSKVDIALFESVIFNRNDGFDFNYLNPIIFYRSIEHQLGSPDNSMMGAQAKVNFKNSQLYSQVLLDDLQVNEFMKSSGWWGNKYGFQLGYKLFDIAKINSLDAQLEFNYVRPFTYTQNSSTIDTLANFTHYNQPLAHPLGANFTELLFKCRYSPLKKLNIELVYSFINRGVDSNSLSYGNNIFLNTKPPIISSEYGNTQLQGVLNQIHFVSMNTSYMIWHNIFVDLDIIYRKSTSSLTSFENNTFGVQAGVRCNIRKRSQIF